MHHSFSLIIVCSELVCFLIFCCGLSFAQFFPSKEGTVKQGGLEHGQTFVIFFHALRQSLKNVTIELTICDELALEQDVVLSALGDLVSFVEHVLDLSSSFFEEDFELICLIGVFAGRSTPWRKNHISELLLFLAFLLEGRDWIMI